MFDVIVIRTSKTSKVPTLRPGPMSRASAGAQWPSTRTVCRLLAKSRPKSAPNRVHQVAVVFEVSGAGPTPEGWRAPEGDARQLDSRIDCCNACPGKALEQDPWCVPGQSLPNPAPSDRPHFSFQGRRASVRIRLENHGAFRPLGRRREPTDGRMDLASVSWTQIDSSADLNPSPAHPSAVCDVGGGSPEGGVARGSLRAHIDGSGHQGVPARRYRT